MRGERDRGGRRGGVTGWGHVQRVHVLGGLEAGAVDREGEVERAGHAPRARDLVGAVPRRLHAEVGPLRAAQTRLGVELEELDRV